MIDLYPFEDASVRFHGNGFMQAELPNGMKMHLWKEGLPKQARATPMHNHNHGFNSYVICGSIREIEFYVQGIGDGFRPYKAIPRHGKDTRLERSNGNHTNAMVKARTFTFGSGSQYDWPLDPQLFHVVVPMTNQALTIVERLDQGDFIPTVMVPDGVEPDNDFDRYGFPEEARRAYAYAQVLLENNVVPPSIK